MQYFKYYRWFSIEIEFKVAVESILCIIFCRLSWSRLGSESLPPNSEDRDGTLIIHGADPSVSGQYVCKAITEGTNLLASESAAPVIIERNQDPREPK